ncbi:type IV toxin-antitoxin system AbiEi family antitoxin domain-containing protein [Gloeobacter violaceus]|uniref:Glr4337 protein n=1 Tax=Gloeobacter violaceus (strain ATCC 29082 / PCC 7421) TaxID=251221 RepID=Q7ND99_GLOVI|nr:type IV toxin-antitoxin system AbiEi family antitoxin domain-containing protein [Gloeobacter violaceus]BAC92278.1 glr4337 [Gloeobacter violaceus PCC 7421]
MNSVKSCKSLESCLPEGQVVDRAWLEARGFDRPRVDSYLRSEALQRVAQGAYRRPGPPLKWEHIVYSLQGLGYAVHVGGRSALELQGLAHYLPMRGVQRIALYGDKVPTWLEKLDAPYRFEHHRPKLFAKIPEHAVTTRSFGHWDWPVRYSTPELALLELLAEVSDEADFQVADKFFESAATLRPDLIRALLLACTNVKAKRLFLWFAARHSHAWQQALDTQGVDLGSGKRMIVKGGAFDKCFEITVPREMADGAEQPFF